jgi:hypothetical protein
MASALFDGLLTTFILTICVNIDFNRTPPPPPHLVYSKGASTVLLNDYYFIS